jgi:hypothetical protein
MIFENSDITSPTFEIANVSTHPLPELSDTMVYDGPSFTTRDRSHEAISLSRARQEFSPCLGPKENSLSADMELGDLLFQWSRSAGYQIRKAMYGAEVKSNLVAIFVYELNRSIQSQAH